MPKLSQEIVKEKKSNIETAAKVLFIKQGFHGTSIRQIAAQAGVSLGNLYNYYKTKEDILESLISKYEDLITARFDEMFSKIEEPLLPENFVKLGKLLQEVVSDHYEFWLLMYIDVLEFDNQHCRKFFEGLSKRFGQRFHKHFYKLKKQKLLNEDIDPALGFTVAYLQFLNYFLIEKLFGGNHHLGINDDEAVLKLSELFCRGLLSSTALEKNFPNN
ncbi:MAG: TetR/AcrR family transcriptional regulator [Acidobacteria bacterium]|nr:TetR/AcrR family transcriptional regulator [Acidobacteriota bacterium]